MSTNKNNFDIEGLDELQDNLKKLANKGVKELNRGLERINNPGAEKESAVPEECPYCGAKLSVNKDAQVIKCAYCGTEFDNSASKSIVDSVFDFVEKQQDVALKMREDKIRELQAKAEIKKHKRKKHGFLRFIFILVVCFAILYYYFVILGGSVPAL